MLRELANRHADDAAAVIAADHTVLDRPRRPVGLLLLATVVHLTSLAWVAAGVDLLVGSRPVPVRVIGVLVVLAGLWLLPRPAVVGRNLVTFGPEDLPETFAFVGRVAEAVGTANVRRVELRADFNCAVSTTLQGRILFLGLPLVRSLPSDQLAALMVHELAHFVAGDPLRGWYVGGARVTMQRWYDLLQPPLPPPERAGIGVLISEYALRGLCWLASWPVIWLIYLFSLLSWRSSQMAEYRADRIAARVAGSGVAAAALSSAELGTSVWLALQRAALADPPAPLWPAVAEHVGSLPADEYERLRRVSVAPGRRTDTTHPPTGHRVAAVLASAVPPPPPMLGADEHERLWAELEARARDVEDTIYGACRVTRPRLG